MKAFVEHLSGVVRVGPDTSEYGKPYDFAVAYSSTDGKTAVIKALVSSGEFTVLHARAIIAELKRLGLSATWDRIKP